MTEPATPRPDMMPPRLLPILYFGAAHLFLAAALAAAVIRPGDVAGFFYHPRMAALVHLVTLGWITSSILGAIHVVGPMALRLSLPARGPDYAACALVTAGTLGMAGHLWLSRHPGMAWSAGLVLAGIAHVAVRVLRSLRRAGIQPAVKLHVVLAFANVLVAGGMGLLLALDKVSGFLPARGLGNVYAHAHLAAVGWAGMMVVGTGYRLLPMVLPSEMPRGRSLYASAVLLEVGAAGLFVSFLAGGRLLPLAALPAVAGFAAFFLHVQWMKRRPRRPPAGFVRPDLGAGQAMAAFACLAACAPIGAWLSLAPASETSLKLAGLYGVLGLVGFLSQIVVGIESRILPMFACAHAIVNAAPGTRIPRPHELPDRRLQGAAFALWLAGVPILAAAMFLESLLLVRVGAAALLLAAALGALNGVRILRHAFPRRAGARGLRVHAPSRPA